MNLTRKQFYAIAAVAGIAAVLVAGNFAISEWKIARLEREVRTSIERAEISERRAAMLEKQAEATREKAEYLERNLLQIKEIAKYQDENIEKISAAANDARPDVERARRVRTIAATVDELCEKLAELGHACD